jgi:Leucine-rich repeat (LRR) protein
MSITAAAIPSAAGEPQNDYLSNLPAPLLLIIHQLVCQPGDLRCTLALEATSKQLRDVFRGNTRIAAVDLHIPTGLRNVSFATCQAHSFWRWLAANRHRLDDLAIWLPWFQKPREGSSNPCPFLGHKASVSMARLLTVNFGQTVPLEVLAGLSNLVGLRCNVLSFCGLQAASSSTSSQPLAAARGLRSLSLQDSFSLNDDPQPDNNARVLDCLAAIAQLRGLSHLEMSSRMPLSSLNHLASLAPTLQSLHVQPAEQVAEHSLEPLACFTHLTHLSVVLSRPNGVNNGVQSLSPLTLLNNLAKLTVSHCHGLPDTGLAPLASLRQSLRDLALVRVQQAAEQPLDLSPIGSLTALHTLSIVFCYIATLQPVACLSGSLEDLAMVASASAGDGSISVYAPISSLSKLKVLEVIEQTCSSLEFLRPLATTHQQLHIDGEEEHSLEPLSALTALRQLTMYKLFGSSGAEAVRALGLLTRLTLESCTGNLSALSALTGLRELCLQQTEHFNDVAPLGALKNLQVLELDDRDFAITDSSKRQLLSALPQLYIRYCCKQHYQCLLGMDRFTIAVNGHCVGLR